MYYYVYIIRSVRFQDTIYVGCTTNVKKRIATHNAGSSTHTSKDHPWELVVSITFQGKDKAGQFERYLKSHSGRSFARKRLV